jgi:hypothetical protein
LCRPLTGQRGNRRPFFWYSSNPLGHSSCPLRENPNTLARLMNAKFSFAEISALPPEERPQRLLELRTELATRLSLAKSPSEFLRESTALVQDLRALGHDLCSFDADDDFEIWCGDWSQDNGGGPLALTFPFPGEVQVEWRHRIKAQSGTLELTGYPIGTVVEGDPSDPKGRRLDSRPAAGGQASSQTYPDGSFEVRLEGPLDVGRADESHALKVLVGALRAAGHRASLLDGAQDSRGEDGRIMLDDAKLPIQIVSVPSDPAPWRSVARGHPHCPGPAFLNGHAAALSSTIGRCFLSSRYDTLSASRLPEVSRVAARFPAPLSARSRPS